MSGKTKEEYLYENGDSESSELGELPEGSYDELINRSGSNKLFYPGLIGWEPDSCSCGMGGCDTCDIGRVFAPLILPPMSFAHPSIRFISALSAFLPKIHERLDFFHELPESWPKLGSSTETPSKIFVKVREEHMPEFIELEFRFERVFQTKPSRAARKLAKKFSGTYIEGRFILPTCGDIVYFRRIEYLQGFEDDRNSIASGILESIAEQFAELCDMSKQANDSSSSH